MEKEQIKKDSLVIILSAIILGLSLSYIEKTWQATLIAFGTILLIILINILAKKIFAQNIETDISLGFWSTYWTGFTQKSHFRKPLAMAWLPLLTSLITKGVFVWMPIIEFDVTPKPERAARRHGLYRYTAVTEWHIALIAVVGIMTNIFTGIGGYILGFTTFAKWSMFYAAWMIFPWGKLDGAKIFFGSRKLWIFMILILLISLFWGLSIV
jgi:hypothetical protein